MTVSSSPASISSKTPQSSADGAHLVRGLTLTATMALVVGTVIGTGVFIKTAIMAQDTGSPQAFSRCAAR